MPDNRGGMISGVFVDCPCLAIVLAVRITMAGALSLLRIPVAPFPDIEPPQIIIPTSIPGASAAVAETTDADRWKRRSSAWKSNSGNDGGYSLSVIFDLGSKMAQEPELDANEAIKKSMRQAVKRRFGR